MVDEKDEWAKVNTRSRRSSMSAGLLDYEGAINIISAEMLCC